MTDKIDEIQRQMDDGVISERKALKALKMQPRSKKGHGSRRFKKRREHGRQ